jgi:hypothetical protein
VVEVSRLASPGQEHGEPGRRQEADRAGWVGRAAVAVVGYASAWELRPAVAADYPALAGQPSLALQKVHPALPAAPARLGVAARVLEAWLRLARVPELVRAAAVDVARSPESDARGPSVAPGVGQPGMARTPTVWPRVVRVARAWLHRAAAAEAAAERQGASAAAPASAWESVLALRTPEGAAAAERPDARPVRAEQRAAAGAW